MLQASARLNDARRGWSGAKLSGSVGFQGMHLVKELHILQEVAAALHVCHRLADRHWQAQVCDLQDLSCKAVQITAAGCGELPRAAR